ncbi:ABC transporter substrate-binding protein [Opitutus sp. ER46]|uniref:ABC transporter substrate-binding protein n=1 Tax=Opitutus sp. ER46 TaxID=2161864 RepID=UPI000D305CE3|nr:ABC transporter substrate-binding protein [Opitutus sp. ER46]PTX91783.1 ethanolamine utilization protein EutJ [Opitutus sp. ER46]
MIVHRLVRALVLGALALFATAASRAAEPIRIGHIASLTGKEAAFGNATRKGILLAVEEINAAGGVLGRPIEYLVEDIQSKPGEAATATKKLISRDRVIAVLGANATANSLEAAPICQRAHIPMMAISSTSPSVTEVGNYIFRICFIDPFQGAVLAKFARSSLHAQRLAILTAATAPYSVGLSRVLRERFIALGGEVVAEQRYADGDKDFRAQLTAIRSTRPDVIAVTGYYTEAALVCLQARELGLQVPFIGGDGWEAPQLTELGGKAVEGSYYSTYFSAGNTAPEVRAFVQRYQTRWNGETPEAVSALGYDALRLVAQAITRIGTTDAPALRDAIAATKDFPGVTGRTTIDEKRNSAKAAVMLVVRQGRTEFFESVTP